MLVLIKTICCVAASAGGAGMTAAIGMGGMMGGMFGGGMSRDVNLYRQAVGRNVLAHVVYGLLTL